MIYKRSDWFYFIVNFSTELCQMNRMYKKLGTKKVMEATAAEDRKS